MANFVGTLRSNEIFSTLYNMIISQLVHSDNIARTGSELVSMAKVDGSLYGDQKLYYATDILGSNEWGADAEAQNLLALHRPAAPDVQSIVLDQFRQISLTVDNYLSKRAWEDKGAFGSFMSVMLGWIGETKNIYEAKLFNTFIGTNTADGTAQNITISLPSDDNAEAENRLQAQTIARTIADTYVKIADAGREYNDFGNYRSFAKEDMILVWNSEYMNTITNMDLPTIYHKEGLDLSFKHSLPAKYFGNVLTTDGTVSGSTANQTIRTLVEVDYNTVPRNDDAYVKSLHIMPGDLIPAGKAYKAYEAYEEDSTIIAKMYHKNSVPFMSAFEVGTTFNNPKSLTENHYLTWGYNTIENLNNYPFITFKAAQA